MGVLEGKVALITGAARGQGRSHAIRLAEEGADIVAVDICAQVPTVPYALATADDLRETAKIIEELGQRVVAAEADVRDLDRLRGVVADAVSELGSVDIVVANAGISGMSSDETENRPEDVFRAVIDINLVGVWNTVVAAAPTMIAAGRGGSIVITGSTRAFRDPGADGSAGMAGYAASKHGVVGLMRNFANWLAPHSIRVNSVHPTGVATPMIFNESMERYLSTRPQSDLLQNLLPVPLIEAVDVSNAIKWLVSDEARYVTGVSLPIDAGFGAR